MLKMLFVLNTARTCLAMPWLLSGPRARVIDVIVVAADLLPALWNATNVASEAILHAIAEIDVAVADETDDEVTVVIVIAIVAEAEAVAVTEEIAATEDVPEAAREAVVAATATGDDRLREAVRRLARRDPSHARQPMTRRRREV